MKPNDLRGILNYIPRFRGKTFVISLDGAVVAEENFANVLLDIAVLRSLNIRVVLVHGAAHQIEMLAKESGEAASDYTGEGMTDDATLELAMTAGNRIAHEILEGFAAHDLRAAVTNAVQAHPAGILRGEDQQNTGKVEKIDVQLLTDLLGRGVVPVVPPFGFDGRGRTFRVNSDSMAEAISEAIQAVKLIYMTTEDGIEVDGELLREIPAAELETRLQSGSLGSSPISLSKARHAVRACKAGVPRVHVINGRTNEGLLTEVFSNEGIGSLVFANDYQQIRKAEASDVRVLIQLTHDSIESEELSSRTREDIETALEDYYIFEIDRHPIGCVAFHHYAEESKGELAFLCVSRSHENQGIGRRLIQFVESQARQAGVETLFLLSTQAYSYFQSKAAFSEGTEADLPERRRRVHLASGRNSKILVKSLAGPGNGVLRSG